MPKLQDLSVSDRNTIFLSVAFVVRPLHIYFLVARNRFVKYIFIPQNKHCLLEADLGCVKHLLRREIYPIIIFIKISEKNIKKLRCAICSRDIKRSPTVLFYGRGGTPVVGKRFTSEFGNAICAT